MMVKVNDVWINPEAVESVFLLVEGTVIIRFVSGNQIFCKETTVEATMEALFPRSVPQTVANARKKGETLHNHTVREFCGEDCPGFNKPLIDGEVHTFQPEGL